MIRPDSSNSNRISKPVARLEYSQALGRAYRAEDWDQLGVLTQRKIQEAIRAGDRQLAIDLTNYQDEGNWVPVIHFAEILSATLTVLVEKAGEENLGAILHTIPETTWNRPDRYRERLTTEDYVAYLAEQHRAAQDAISIHEEWDRFVITLDHCNTGGRMARLRDAHGDLYPAVGRTSRGYPWSWGRAGIPYYCCLQAVFSEIRPIELRGSPDFITECRAGERRSCVRYVYKSPELVPPEYYARVGCAKAEGSKRRGSWTNG